MAILRMGLALLLLGCAAAQEQAKAPNIVFVLADDMGYGDPASCNPESKIATPNIDRIASEGMRFTDAHAPGSVCVPSRYGLLTGRYACRRRRYQPAREAVIQEGTKTIADVLRADGYRTAMVGKWHLGFDSAQQLDYADMRGGPVDRGFEQFFGIPASLDIPPYYYVNGRAAVAAPSERIAVSNTDGWSPIQGAFWRAGGVAPGFVHSEVLPRFRDQALSIIHEHDGKQPLFLYLALPAPHTPWLPEQRYRNKSAAGMYGDFVMQVDGIVGDVLGALDQQGMAENTLVFFTSDNGPVWYPKDAERFGHRSVGPLRGMKGDAFEGGHRVPFLARWPARIAKGSSSDQTVCFSDVMATCAAAADGELAEDCGEDSISFLPQLLGHPATKRREVTVLKAGATVVREGKWKLIRHKGSGGFTRNAKTGASRGQLYDLDADLGETNNLYAKHPDIVARLAQHAARAHPTNVIVILADDMGYGDSSVYDGWIKTPGMERMAREGLTFTDFHSSGVVCSPTRAGLLTGRYQQRAGIPGVVNADPRHPAHKLGLKREEFTFAEGLRGAGYRTAIFGKWHVGYDVKFNPVHHGFDEFCGFVSGNIDYHSHLDRMNTADWWHGTKLLEREGYLTDLITQDAVRFIGENRDQPFCLYVAHGAVHSPIQVPDGEAVRGDGRGPKDKRTRDEKVKLMMKSLDDSVTSILNAVRKNGIAGSTLVLFFSDNGGAAHMRCDPLRGKKGSVWEGGHRVPAIAWWPGTIAKGTKTDQLCISLDVMPTMLELAGQELPTERKLDGQSLVPLLRDREALGHRELFWNGVAMRADTWKLVVQKNQPLLFDLAKDIGEKNDVAALHPERVQSMLAALLEWRRDVGN
ncbi:MAG: arylsulfatase A [Planctomycetota bacterium]|jgi:arylsulfatase A